MASLWSRVSDVFKSDEVDDFEDDDDDDDGDNRDSDEAHGNNHKNNHSSNGDDNNDSDNQDSDTDGAEDDAESEEVGCPFPAQCVRMPPPCESWPDRPILLRVNDTQFEENRLSENYAAEDCGQGAFRINRIAKFESALCKGRMLVRIREERHATEHSRKYFAQGGRRIWASTVQVKFKERIRCDDLVAGMHGHRPSIYPYQQVVRPVLNFIKFIWSHGHLDLTGDEPYFWQLQCESMQCSVLDESATQEELDDHMILPREDTDIWLGKTMTTNSSGVGTGRIAYMHKHAAEHWFEPEYTYTFSYFTHLLDVQNFEAVIDLKLTTIKLPLKTLLNGVVPHEQAIQKSRPDRCAWSYQIFHENIPLDLACVDTDNSSISTEEAGEDVDIT